MPQLPSLFTLSVSAFNQGCVSFDHMSRYWGSCWEGMEENLQRSELQVHWPGMSRSAAALGRASPAQQTTPSTT